MSDDDRRFENWDKMAWCPNCDSQGVLPNEHFKPTADDHTHVRCVYCTAEWEYKEWVQNDGT